MKKLCSVFILVTTLLAAQLLVGFEIPKITPKTAIAAECGASVRFSQLSMRIGQPGTVTGSLEPSNMSGGSIQYLGGAPSGVTVIASGKSVTITMSSTATSPGTLRFNMIGGNRGSEQCAGGSVTFDIRAGTNIDCFSSFSTNPSPVIGGRSATLRYSGRYEINKTGTIAVQPGSSGKVSNISSNSATFSSARELDERVSFVLSGFSSPSGVCATDTFYASVAPNCPTFSTVLIDEPNRILRVGDRTKVRAPNSWRWGQFFTYDPNIISLNMLGSGEAELIAVGVGTTGIYGAGFQASNGATNCALRAVSLTVMEPEEPPVCPDEFIYQLQLRKGEIIVGETTEVVLPSGWFGGTLTLNNSTVARLQESPDGKLYILGLSAGSVTVTGGGFSADNGATGCDIGPSTLEVKPEPAASLSVAPNPLLLCPGETTGSVTVTFESNVFYELRVTGAKGLADDSVLATGAAATNKTFSSGQWVQNGTKFLLVAPLYNERVLADVTVATQEKVCATPPPNPPPGGPPGGTPGGGGNSLSASLYNTLTAPVAVGSVAQCNILAVWQWSGGASTSFTLSNKTTGQSWNAPSSARSLTVTPSNPASVSEYELSAVSSGNSLAKVKPQFSPLAPVYPCAGGVRLGNSNKDVIAIAGRELQNDTFAKAEANLPLGFKVYEGDLVRFAVNIINTGQDSFAGTIVVDDLFVNLVRPEGGWQESISCGKACVLQEVRYDEATKHLVFRIRTQGDGLVPYKGAGDVWILSFNAVPKAPPQSKSLLHTFQNIATINGSSSANLVTPKVPFLRKTQAPTIIEVQ